MLRHYQQLVLDKMLWAKSLEGNDIVTLAQGGGKSHIIAEFANQLGEPILILTPNKEITEQDLDKLRAVVPHEEIGIYSASMNSKEVRKYTLATIQSAYKHPEQFAHYQVAIVDECDLVNPKNLHGMYNTFFKAIGNPKVYGLTGTPFRQDIRYERWGYEKWQVKSITITKMINRYKPFFWNRMLAVVNTKYLREQGFLSPIEYHDMSLYDHVEIPTNKSKSDFDMDKFDEMLSDKYGTIAHNIEALPHNAKLIFCASIKQAEALQRLIPGSMVVTSETSKKERERASSELRSGKLKCLLNVGIYTVGFDYPELDCIVLLRPTRSLRLHCQILGRVARIAEGKEFGHVYDFVSNCKNLGELEDIRIEKVEGKWNVTSPAYPQGFHGIGLYSYKLKRKKDYAQKMEP